MRSRPAAAARASRPESADLPRINPAQHAFTFRAGNFRQIARTPGERFAREPRERQRLDLLDRYAVLGRREQLARRDFLGEILHQRRVVRTAAAYDELLRSGRVSANRVADRTRGERYERRLDILRFIVEVRGRQPLL